MKTENNRYYGSAVEVDRESVKTFWNKRAAKDTSIKSVLCGTDFAPNSGIIRNEREKALLQGFLSGAKKMSVLDIGCGIGRWAYNLADIAAPYHGIDFSQEFIKNAKAAFKDNPNMDFFCMSATDIDTSRLLTFYDLIIITGVTMYINDSDIGRFFNVCASLQTPPAAITGGVLDVFTFKNQ